MTNITRNWQALLLVAIVALVSIYFIVQIWLNLPSNWWPLPVAMLASVALAVAAAAYYTPRSISYLGAMVATVPEALLFSALSIVLSYISALNLSRTFFSGSNTFAVFIGIAVGLVFWLLSAALYCALHLSGVDGANPRSYGLLCQRLDQLDKRLAVLCPPNSMPNLPDQDKKAACAEAWSQRDRIYANLYPTESQPEANPGLGAGTYGTAGVGNTPAAQNQRLEGLQWVVGWGYITLWNWMHRAEEALIDIEPPEQLVGYAISDKLRLDDSNISQRNDLVGILQVASKRLSVPASIYVDIPNPIPDGAPVLQGVPLQQEQQARAALRQVRRAINDFRDNRWGGLVLARNALVETLIACSVFAYGLLVISVLLAVPANAVATASIFFVVGALVGLFNRLRIGPGLHAELDDYGLNHARLVTVPVLSGLAALFGVTLFAMAPALLNAQVLTPQSTPSATLTPPRVAVVSSNANAPTATVTPPPSLTLTPTPTATTPPSSHPPNTIMSISDGLLEPIAAVLAENTSSLTYLSKGQRIIVSEVQANVYQAAPLTLTPTNTATPPSTPTLAATITRTSASTTAGTPTVTPTVTPTGTPTGSPTGTPTGTPSTPTSANIPEGAAAPPNKLPRLEDIFNLEANLFGLVIAATFGLTPALVIGALQKETDNYKIDLKSTETQASSTG
jgi:hypothetical protein